MNESTRTITYVIAAAVSVGLALLLSPSGEMTPESLKLANVGKPFYDDFNPAEATSIDVFAYDEAKAVPKAFGVKFEKGKWTIPSHHNYPADGADRLAKTAASARGIKREELASSSPQDHEKLGVIDPNDDDKTKVKGRGKRFTLKKGDTVLVDLILGNQLKERPGFFFIRKPGENETYVAKVSIDLSTKFSDWVETDLLKLDKNDLTEMEVVMNFQAQKVNGRMQVVPGETNMLIHEKPADPWKLEGIEEGEEVDTTKVNNMVSALDDLKLAGVRPKPKGIRPDLTIDPEFVKKQADLDRLVLDIQSRGYMLEPDREKKNAIKMYGDEGELVAATNKGAVYTLKFGAVFLGDESEIEMGSATDGDKPAEKAKEEGAIDDKAEDNNAKATAGKQPSRYLFVTVNFDEKHLGPPPEKPAPPEEVAAADDAEAKPAKKAPKKEPLDDEKDEPKKPAESSTPPEDKTEDKAADSEGTSKKPADESAKDKGAKDQASKTDAGDENCVPIPAAADDTDNKEELKPEKSDDKQNGEKPDTEDAKADDKKEANQKDGDEKPKPDAPAPDVKSQPAPKEEKKKSADELKKEYDTQVKKYEADLKAYQDKVAAGKKQVEELNARFSAWYYVISAENFNKLHVSRKDLVKAKGKPADDKKATENPEQMDEDKDEPAQDPLESLDDEKKPEQKPE